MAKQSAEELMLLGYISQLPQEQKDLIEHWKDKLKTILDEAGDEGLIALSLVAMQKVSE